MYLETTVRRRGDKEYRYLSLMEAVRTGGKNTHRTLLCPGGGRASWRPARPHHRRPEPVARTSAELGQEVLADTAGHGIQDTRSAARLDELEQALLQERETLAQRTEELDAARQINRELIGRLNRGRQ